MKTFYFFSHKNKRNNDRKKDNGDLKKLFLIVFMVSSLFFANIHPAKAIPVEDIPKFVWDKIKDAWEKGGSIAYQKTLSTVLNKIAYDAANYVGSGGKGQKALFVTKDFGQYAKDLADEAAGTFLETFVNAVNVSDNTTGCENKYEICAKNCFDTLEEKGDQAKFDACQKVCETNLASCKKNADSVASGAKDPSRTGGNTFNICQPSSIEAKLKISLGLAEQRRPNAPNCTASKMINNWGESIEDKYKSFASGEFTKNLSQYFDPNNNDLGILVSVNSDLQKTTAEKEKTEFDKTLAKGGWLDARNWAGKTETIPDAGKDAIKDAKELRKENFGKTTNNILIDALNVFMNQTAMTAFNSAMKKLAKLTDKKTPVADSLIINPQADPNVSIGVSSVKERTMKILEVNSSTDREIDILAELASCIKPENPSPNNCVIDDRFMQAIIDRKTVAKAIEDGQISANWKVEKDVFPSAYKEHFSLRNIKILRKHRILPIGWEIAIERAFADPAKSRQATLGDLVACFDPKDSFESFSSSFDVSDTLWCEGLVDPNWLLKAPISYCGQKGSGSYIYEMSYSKESLAYGAGDNLTIFRSEDYCADNQTCIKEGRDGGCDAFGYCVEERRTWKFEDELCSPINNTCQNFVNSSTGISTSYLENTIDYGNCNVDSAGCRRYSISGNYTDTGLVEWNFSKNFYFNKNLVSCNESSDGCSQLIRVKPTWGTNLVIDSSLRTASPLAEYSTGDKIGSFEVVSSNQSAAVKIASADEVLDGITNNTIKATGLASVGVKSSLETFPKDLQVLKKQNYTLSAEVFLVAGDRLEAKLNPGDGQSVQVVNGLDRWQKINITSNSVTGLSLPSFSFIAFSQNQGSEVSFYIKNIKLELGDWATNYETYGNRKINQKIIPKYLEKSCYVDPYSASKDYSLKSGAPAICSNYARQCNYDEVGCNLFRKKDDVFSVPAKVFSSDYCPSDCLGYDVYVSKENYFNSIEAENLIPNKAKVCSQEAVGCNEFTNLDKVTQGGESKEYYSLLKQCIKPDSSKCSQFYVWETSNSGVQIKTFNLQKDNQGNPLTTFKNQADGDCSDIYDLPAADPEYNPDCSEFRNSSGKISYRLVSSLITCSDNCFNYRLSEKNIDSTIKMAGECSGLDKHWNAGSSICYSCLNGGLWSDDQGACIYKAIPDEGKKCSASDLSCREYNGSQGNNVKTILASNFDSSLDGWESDLGGGVSLAPISNSRKGQSLYYEAGNKKVIKLKIGSKIEKSASYTLRFLARSSEANSLNIYFINDENGESYFFNAVDDVSVRSVVPVSGGDGWNVYNVSLNSLPDNIGENGTLNILATKNFYLDNLVLTKVNSRHYLLKNSLSIPDACYYDNLGEYQGADYNLGCYQYQDQNNLIHNLHNFGDICSNSSIGCEQMISTNNSNSPYSEIWKDDNKNGLCDNDEKNCVKVERDEAIYAIYDKNKTCLAEDVGCSRMGEGLGYGNQVSWSDVFKLNNPNNYSKTLCFENDLGCEEYKDSQGSLSYFRNPANNVCVYRNSNDSITKGKFWFKSPVKRCDLNKKDGIDGAEKNGPACNIDSDCSSGTCIVDNNDYYCPVSYLKTIGYGGINSSIPVPDGAVGLCDQTEAGCTEYIDPVSYFNPNAIKNSNFSDNGKFWGSDTWAGANIKNNQQVINFSRNKLYSLKKIDADSKALITASSTVSLSFVSFVRILQEDNTFSEPVKEIVLNSTSSGPYVIFNSLENYSALLNGGEVNKQIELKEVSVSYNKNNITTNDCAGIVNLNEGCILFNERSINGSSGFKKNSFNAFATVNSKNPVTNYGPYTANELLKVSPDRNCSTWLSCTSYTIENERKLCTSMAECNLLDDKNECANYITRAPEGCNKNGTCDAVRGENFSNCPQDCATGQSYEAYPFDQEKDKNASGYSLPNSFYFNNIKEVGFNTRARYNLEESIPTLSCFASNEKGTPVKDKGCSFDINIVRDSLVRTPLNSPVKYPAEGKTYLKVASSQAISPQAAGSYITLPGAGKYYISYLVNTKNSNTEAVVTIVEHNNTPSSPYKIIKQFSSDSPVDWKREVKEFEVTEETKIRIYLSSKKTDSSSAVYFDDVNIETVLKIGDNKYTTRDCRLYPTSSSLSCKEVDNTIVRNGVEGYCLEYDLANSSVCELWMPLDRISSARVSSNQLGYNGKYPLSYCAEVDSNFIFLEKRVASIIREARVKKYKDITSKSCYYPGESLNFCSSSFSSTVYDEISSPSTTAQGEYDVTITLSDPNNPASSTINVSGNQNLSTTQQPTVTTFTASPYDFANRGDVVKDYCGDSGNYFLLISNDLEKERSWIQRDYFTASHICIPINKKGYYSNRASSTYRYVASNSESITTINGFEKIQANSDGWYFADGFHSIAPITANVDKSYSGINELTNDKEPLRVLDLNYSAPSNEGDLKKITSSKPKEVFRLTCNKFVETVSSNGDNMAWTERVNVGSDYSIQPVDGIIYNNYVRKLGDIPFGAASWSKDFNLINSPRVNLSNQFSQAEKETVSAGRPYGCDTSDPSRFVNCSRIGFCSANPDVYCLLDSGFFSYNNGTLTSGTKYFSNTTYDIARHSCGSWGTCKPLWSFPNYNDISGNALKLYERPLSQIFRQASNAYEFKQNDGGYVSAPGYYSSSDLNTRPVISESPKLFSSVGEVINKNNLKSGTYRLDFYTQIDANSQPLREIFIDWGDENKQIITGQDARTKASKFPHSFYHYYSSSPKDAQIKVKIYDNWGNSSVEQIVK